MRYPKYIVERDEEGRISGLREIEEGFDSPYGSQTNNRCSENGIGRREFLKLAASALVLGMAGSMASSLFGKGSDAIEKSDGVRDDYEIVFVTEHPDRREMYRILTSRLGEEDDVPLLDKEDALTYIKIRTSEYAPVVREAARDLGWDADDAIYTAFIESSLEHFDKKGVPKRSASGAYGLMGVKPEAFRDVLGVIDIDYARDRLSKGKGFRRWVNFANEIPSIPRELGYLKEKGEKDGWEIVKQDPATNARVGIAYRMMHFHESGGNIEEARKRYYAGPGNIMKNGGIARIAERYSMLHKELERICEAGDSRMMLYYDIYGERLAELSRE